MIRLSEDYIRGLEPETLRYDVTIDEDFVISVLPNGIKTWAFLYEYQGRQRRKTLGVYPDMGNQQALQALANARKMVVTLGADIADRAVEESDVAIVAPAHASQSLPPATRPAVLATRRRYQPQPRRSGRRPRATFLRALGALAVIAICAAIFVRWQSIQTVPTAAPVQSTTSAPATAAGARIFAPQPIATASASSPTPVTTAIDAAAILATDNDTVPPGDEQPRLGSEPTQPPTAARIALPTTETGTQDNGDRMQDQIELTASEPPLATPTKTPPPVAVPPPTSVALPTDATAVGGEVTRAVVTTGVTDLEPVDDLDGEILLGDDGFQTIFFFSELRNFSRGHIVHRWALDGRVIADVPLRVDGGWRWRTYSSKDLLPGMTGDWQVAVIDGDGRVLSERQFSFRR